MIIFSAFVPHSPLLLSSIGKENSSKLQASINAIRRLSEELYASRPDVCVFLSSHGEIHSSAFSVNLHQSYSVDFSDFGDFSTHATFLADTELVTNIQRKMRAVDLAFTLDSHEKLDYGFGVPLMLMSRFAKKPNVIPITHSFQSAKSHVQFGRILKDVFSASQKRIAVIATGDLSHALSTDSPAGFVPEGVEFDSLIKQAVQNGSLSQLLSIPPAVVERASECSYRPLLILFGIMEKLSVRTEIYSYEHPFGVGELVAHFPFHV